MHKIWANKPLTPSDWDSCVLSESGDAAGLSLGHWLTLLPLDRNPVDLISLQDDRFLASFTLARDDRLTSDIYPTGCHMGLSEQHLNRRTIEELRTVS